MNTHSREGDCRMEVLAAASVRNQVPYPVLEEILQCVTTEEAVRKLDACGKKDAVMQDLLSKIMFYLNKRAAGKMQIEVILYSNEFGELAKSAGAEKFLQELMLSLIHIWLAGNASYFGKIVEKPYIGDAERAVETEDIKRTNRLLYATAVLCEAICLLVLLVILLIS